MLSRLAWHSVWLLLARLGTQAGAVLFSIILARQLGTSGFGEYAFIAAILFVANALTTFGTDMLLIREIAALGDLSQLPEAVLLQLILSAACMVAVWQWGASIPNQDLEVIAALKIYSLALMPLAFFTVFTTALRGTQHMDAYMSINLASALLQLSALLFFRTSLVSLCILLVGAQVLTAAGAGWVCSIVIPDFWQRWHWTAKLPLAFLRATAPLALLTVLTIVYQRLSVLMLSLLATPTQTGVFSAALRAVEASKTMHLAAFAALYPAMSKARTDQADRSEWQETLSTSWKILLAGALLIALLLFSSAAWLVPFLFGSGFAASAAVLRIMAWVLIPFTINTYWTLSYLAARREKLVGVALAVGLLGLLVLNAWWIPQYGPTGSAWAGLLAECAQSVVLLAGRNSFLQIKGGAREFSELS